MKSITIYSLNNGREELSEGEWFSRADTTMVYHRVDGPAIEYGDVSKFWFIDGEQLSIWKFERMIREVKDMPLVLRLVDPRRWVREYVD